MSLPRLLVLMVSLTFASCVYAQQVADEATARDLEKSLKVSQDALAAGDVDAFVKSLSQRSASSLRNALASEGQELDAAAMGMIARAFGKVFEGRRVGALREGDTAGLVVVQEGRKGVDGQTYFVLRRFVLENGRWVLDGQASKGVTPKPNETPGWQQINWPADLRIDGHVYAAAALLPKAEIAGLFDVFAYHYAGTLKINGIEQTNGEVNGSTSGYIRGGLKKGVNTVEFTARAAATQPIDLRAPRLSIRQRASDRRSSTVVFEHEFTEQAVIEFQETFAVAAATQPATRPSRP